MLKELIANRRSRKANYRLGGILAFVAGATNAGGFIAIGTYTSHMSGITSSVADDLALGKLQLAGYGVSMLLAFMVGAASTAFLVNWAKRSKHSTHFLLPILLETLLLVIFGSLAGLPLFRGDAQSAWAVGPLLAYLMGLQNALITKVARAEIRTTHVTGMVTDLGIELGKLFYWNRDKSGTHSKVMANRQKMRSHTLVLSSFFLGALAGALGFKYFGFYAVLPLAALLLAVAWPHIRLADFSVSKKGLLP